MPQYGAENAAGSVIGINPTSGTQTDVAQDIGTVSMPQMNVNLGWFVTGDAWDPNYQYAPGQYAPRVIVDALEGNGKGAPNFGHLEAVDPSTRALSEVTMNQLPFNNPPGPRNYISSCLGMITYLTGGTHAAASAGSGRTNLAAANVGLLDTVDGPSLVSSLDGTHPLTFPLGQANLVPASGSRPRSDRQVPAVQADLLGASEQVTPNWSPSLQDGSPSSANPGSREAEVFFVDFAGSQPAGLVTTPQGFGTM